jgi:uncharacterized protein (TIGR01777 family)
MRIALTGATGFIGTRLVDRLLADGHDVSVLTRRPRSGTSPRYFAWDYQEGDAPREALEGRDAVVNLAGEPVAQRWNETARQRIRDSRVQGTRRLVRTLARLQNKPRVLLSASAVGLYGSRGDEVLTESSKPASGFLADVTREWEREAREAAVFGMRVVSMRIGIVLGEGGALKAMLPAFRLGMGGQMGNGRQWMSWIHADDLVRLIIFAIGNTALEGAVNATAPNPVTNREFTSTLAMVLHRPALMAVPEFALKLLFGEMSSVMLASQRVVPEKASGAGFAFRYPVLRDALEEVVRKV